MIVKEYIKRFEKLGFGMFVHFGPYSVVGKGEYVKYMHKMPWEEYMTYVQKFIPKKDWAEELVKVAKNAGVRYITLTTRHHDGFSLYDTCGITEYDAMHVCGRDLVREFVDACRAADIIPFFYHTLLDWHEESFRRDFPTYLKYLRASVEVLCRNYGEIGGFWFDGTWAKKDADWEEDALYGMIRSYQPETMIINNTSTSARGELGHIELDSVTFERGKPKPINMAESPKYVASEMCDVFGNHWGYAEWDLAFRSPAEMIKSLMQCRRYGSNLLLNVGPMGDGSLRPIDVAIYEMIGKWVSLHDEVLSALPSGIKVENKEDDFILEKDGVYYLVCMDLPMESDARGDADFTEVFKLSKTIKSVTWLDNGEDVEFVQNEDNVTVTAKPFRYGSHLVVRIAKITV